MVKIIGLVPRVLQGVVRFIGLVPRVLQGVVRFIGLVPRVLQGVVRFRLCGKSGTFCELIFDGSYPQF